VATISKENKDGSTLNVYLIDAISGRTLYHTYHKNARNPVNIVQSENWVIYGFWNSYLLRTELVILELYENEEAFYQKHGNETATSFVQPSVLSQSYLFPTQIKTLEVTTTARGITSRQLLAGTYSDAVYIIDKKFIDPRRPISMPSNADKEEGIIPYSAILPVNPKTSLSYNYTINGLRGIKSAPALIESTSLVFCYGIDLFFVRISPSKAYDLLNEDFNFAALLLTTSVLLVITAVVWWLSKRKDLNRSWK